MHRAQQRVAMSQSDAMAEYHQDGTNTDVIGVLCGGRRVTGKPWHVTALFEALPKAARTLSMYKAERVEQWVKHFREVGSQVDRSKA